MQIFAIFIGLLAATVSSTMALSENAQELVKGMTNVGMSIYKKTVDNTTGNLVFSPYSALTVLAYISTGAVGSTSDQMSQVLLLPDCPDTTASDFQELTPALTTNSSGVLVATANRLYVPSDVQITDPFKAFSESFNAGIENVDFSDATGSAQKINQWVEEQTNDKIKNLIAPDVISSDTRLIAVNAVYFKGSWLNKMRVLDPQDFHVDDNTVVKTPFITVEKRMPYVSDEELGAQVLDIPYQNRNYSFVIVLPFNKNGLEELEAKMPFTLPDRMSRLVNVQMPKMKIESTIPVADTLKKLGMTIPFSNAADFSGIAPEHLKIDTVLQKAFIAVDENGTEAAAATYVGFATASLDTTKPIPIVVDHPFLFILQEISTKAILFMGRFTTPEN